jgi:hypothetical protein
MHSPIRLHGVVLNYLSTGITLPLLHNYSQKKRRKITAKTGEVKGLEMTVILLTGNKFEFQAL